MTQLKTWLFYFVSFSLFSAKRLRNPIFKIVWFHQLYIYIYIYIYNSTISDIEHSPNYIALGSPQTHKVDLWQPTLLQYIYIYIYILCFSPGNKFYKINFEYYLHHSLEIEYSNFLIYSFHFRNKIRYNSEDTSWCRFDVKSKYFAR